MIIQLYAVSKDERGPDIEFDCPACGTQGAIGETYESTEIAKLFFLIPVLKLRNTMVKCTNCGESMVSTSSLAEISQSSKARIQSAIRYHPSRLGKVLSLLSFLLCLCPGVNVLLPAVALYVVRGTRGWAKGLAMLALIVGITISLVVGFFVVADICKQYGVTFAARRVVPFHVTTPGRRVPG
ncbi:MAG: hypothetical protein D6820_03595 [Lentisphaerae bacterium]|nr:MAG: hypothetical protein D6820_03595 [Lentisphaerota bacterium]